MRGARGDHHVRLALVMASFAIATHAMARATREELGQTFRPLLVREHAEVGHSELSTQDHPELSPSNDEPPERWRHLHLSVRNDGAGPAIDVSCSPRPGLDFYVKS